METTQKIFDELDLLGTNIGNKFGAYFIYAEHNNELCLFVYTTYNDAYFLCVIDKTYKDFIKNDATQNDIVTILKQHRHIDILNSTNENIISFANTNNEHDTTYILERISFAKKRLNIQ